MATKFCNIVDIMRNKRKAYHAASGFTTPASSEHMCAILKDDVPIIYGSNTYNVHNILTEHAEAQAFRRLNEKIGKTLNAKRITIDIISIRVNGSNAKPCQRCIQTMQRYNNIFFIRYVYYTCHEEPGGLKRVKFSQLVNEPHHLCGFDKKFKLECTIYCFEGTCWRD